MTVVDMCIIQRLPITARGIGHRVARVRALHAGARPHLAGTRLVAALLHDVRPSSPQVVMLVNLYNIH